MKRLNLSLILLSAALLLSQCDPNVSQRTPEPGRADFSRYVAVGNSLTAGYSDDALYLDGQIHSLPNILAGQMKEAGGGEFRQPLVAPGVGSNAAMQARLVLRPAVGADGQPTLAPGRAAEQGQPIFADRVQGPIHNLGVPGARSYHIPLEGYGNTAAGPGNFNPFFTRFKSGPMASVLGDALQSQPTFFSLWIGNNDVLGYATSGGSGNPDGGMGSTDITPQAVFQQSTTGIVTALSGGGQVPGVVLSIPDVTSIPYFNTIPWNGLVLTAEQAAQLRAAYAAQGLDPDQVPGLDFKAGPNGFIIADPAHPAGRRNAVAGEMILLSAPQDSLALHGLGSIVPIGNRHTLRADQINSIRTATAAFNTHLENLANAQDLAWVDMGALLERVANPGVVFDGVRLNAQFVQGGAFSLDGVHLTAQGSAVVANAVIEQINRKYGSTLSPVNISAYTGVAFP